MSRGVYHAGMISSGSAASRCAAVLWAALLITACTFRPGTPEARAEFFIEKLVTAPQETEELAAVAVLPPASGADVLVEGVAARAGLAYLRARARLGAKIRVDVSDSLQRKDRQTVTVTAREGYTGGDVVRFRVHLERRDDEWRVTMVTSD